MCRVRVHATPDALSGSGGGGVGAQRKAGGWTMLGMGWMGRGTWGETNWFPCRAVAARASRGYPFSMVVMWQRPTSRPAAPAPPSLPPPSLSVPPSLPKPAPVTSRVQMGGSWGEVGWGGGWVVWRHGYMRWNGQVGGGRQAGSQPQVASTRVCARSDAAAGPRAAARCANAQLACLFPFCRVCLTELK